MRMVRGREKESGQGREGERRKMERGRDGGR